MIEEFLWNVLDFFSYVNDTWWFRVIKVILALYLAVLFVNIVLVGIMDNFFTQARKGFKGYRSSPLSKGRVHRRWKKIEKRLGRADSAQWKIAILEADTFADDYLGRDRYKGDNVAEKLAGVEKKHFSNIDLIKDAHTVRNKIIHDDQLVISQEEAHKVIADYKTVMEDMDIL